MTRQFKTAAAAALLVLMAAQSSEAVTWVVIGPHPYVDDLEPERGLYGEKSSSSEFWWDALSVSKLRRALPLGYYKVRMIAIPDRRLDLGGPLGDADFAVELRDESDSGEYKIVTTELPVPVSWYRDLAMARNLPATAMTDDSVSEQSEDSNWGKEIVRQIAQRSEEQGPAEPCEIPIGNSLGRRLVDTWTVMLGRTHYSKENERVVRDPKDDRYRGFDFHFDNERMEGAAPVELSEGTRPELLVATGLAMRDYCKSKDERYLKILATKLAALEKRLPELKQRGRKS